MTHDDDLLLALNELSESMRFDSRLYAAAFLHGLRPGAEISNVIAVADDNLVTATAEREIDGKTRVIHVRTVGSLPHTDADTHGHGHIVTDIDRLDLLENAEFLFLEFFKRT